MFSDSSMIFRPGSRTQHRGDFREDSPSNPRSETSPPQDATHPLVCPGSPSSPRGLERTEVPLDSTTAHSTTSLPAGTVVVDSNSSCGIVLAKGRGVATEDGKTIVRFV